MSKVKQKIAETIAVGLVVMLGLTLIFVLTCNAISKIKQWWYFLAL